MEYYLFPILGFIILFIIIIPLYFRLKKTKHQLIALMIKGSATMVPVLFSLASIIQLGRKPYQNIGSAHLPGASCWLLIGLLLCLIGDIIIGIHFLGGIVAFLLGHICYITAFSNLASLQLWSIVIFIVLFLLTLVVFYPLIPKMSKNKIPFLFYGTVILTMLSLALLLPYTIGYLGILPAIGAFLFVLSDFLLARIMLVKFTPLSDVVSLYIYYLGQFALAMSVYLYSSITY